MTPSGERPDVLVIGAGAAGLGAALAAREAGARVKVIAKDAGATGFSTGAWDLDAPGGPHPLLDRRSLAERLEGVRRAHGSHPLARLGGRVADVEAAVRALAGVLPAFHAGNRDHGGPLVVSEVGLFRRAIFAHSSLLDLAPLPRARVAVANLPELAMNADFVAASLDAEARSTGDPRRFVAIEVELFRRARDETLLPTQLAAVLDAPAALERFIVAAKRALAGLPFDALLVPPILGWRRLTVRAEIERALGVKVGEAVSSLEGAQGQRLTDAIRAALVAREVAFEAHVARRVVCDASGAEVELDEGTATAATVVLATGRLVGGGLREESAELHEPLARLPVHEDGAPVGRSGAARGRDPQNRLGADPFALAAGWRAGVSVDAAMRPKATDGEVVSDRLFAAGSILDGIGPTGPGAGLVACAATGFLAGRAAAQRALTIPRVSRPPPAS